MQETRTATDRDPLLGINHGNNDHARTPVQRRRSTIFKSFASRKPDDIVEYNGNHHLSVLFQMHGSVWGRVLPWCLAVCVESLLIIGLRHFRIVDLTVSNPAGHNFMSLLISFLLVTRSTITYNRFMEARGYLSDLYRSSREVVQYACLLTAGKNGHPAAVLWRQQVAYKAIICLRMAAAAVEFRSMGRPCWHELGTGDVHETELLMSDRPMNNNSTSNVSYEHNDNNKNINEHSSSSLSYTHQDSALFMDLAHGPRTTADENMRAPLVWGYNLRQELLKPRIDEEILKGRALHANEELKLLALVSDFIKAFHGHKKLITTPFPFPMVRARIVLGPSYLIFYLILLIVGANGPYFLALLGIFSAVCIGNRVRFET